LIILTISIPDNVREEDSKLFPVKAYLPILFYIYTMTFPISGIYQNNKIVYTVNSNDFETFNLTLQDAGEIKELLPEKLTLVKGQQYFSNLDKFLLELIEEWRNDS
jgi:hypothetical protein